MTLLAPGIRINAAGGINTGTSFSAPHVAGAVAILRAPGIVGGDSLDDTVRRMTSTGRPVYDAFRGITTPRLDLFKAVRSTRELTR